jgi:drug/metabolite transporter (DMT)-like permease
MSSTTMSPAMIGNLLLLISLVSTAVSQVLFKDVLNRLDATSLQWSTLQALFQSPALILRVTLASVLVGAGFIFWMFSIARLNLSYAYPVASSSVLLVAFLSGMFLGEPLTLRVWGGTVLILAGIILLSPQAA